MGLRGFLLLAVGCARLALGHRPRVFERCGCH